MCITVYVYMHVHMVLYHYSCYIHLGTECTLAAFSLTGGMSGGRRTRTMQNTTTLNSNKQKLMNFTETAKGDIVY